MIGWQGEALLGFGVGQRKTTSFSRFITLHVFNRKMEHFPMKNMICKKRTGLEIVMLFHLKWR